jgi:hypothetical protein
VLRRPVEPAPNGQIRWRTVCPLCADCVAKVRKLQGRDFFAKTRNGKQSTIRIISIALPKSPVSFARGDEVPHIFTRKPRLQPAEFLITSAKRLFATQSAKSRHRLGIQFCDTWACSCTRTGSVTKKVDPCPTCDSIRIRPPCISMMRFDMASPSPVPSFLRVFGLSAC